MQFRAPPSLIILLAALLAPSAGCTSIRDYVHNSFKVGPDYARPGAPVAANWIDSSDRRVHGETVDLAGWWTIFGDPVLNDLILEANSQNLTLRQAGMRILQARAQLNFTVGNIFPQTQTANGAYRRIGAGTAFFDQYSFSFNLAWELDFWGRFRRAIQAAEATLDASVADYDAVLVTLLGDVASNYVRYRTDEERIRLLQNNISIQEDVLRFITGRLAAGVQGIVETDKRQASANLNQSRAALNVLQIDLRQAQNQLCVLLGMPVIDLSQRLAAGPQRIPVTPDYVVTGLPADLLRRRPDVRRAERIAAAQAEQIGIAEADLYPAFSVTGTLGWQATQLNDLFKPASLNANVGPSFRWNLLNYGRIRNNVLFQDARFRELVAAYQAQVLEADVEVEDAIISFLKSQDRARSLGLAVDDSIVALQIVVGQYRLGVNFATVDFNRYAVIQQGLIQQQDLWAQSRGQIAQSLIDVYRALGGGWELRCGQAPDKRGILSPPASLPQPESVQAPPADELPVPLPGPDQAK
jgi:NodT family efflux transporter outer membrane factor (OMF) lipoprotein